MADFIISGVYPCASPLFRSKSVRGANLCCLRIISLCWERREGGGGEGGQQTQLGKLLSSPKFKNCQGDRQISLEGGNCASERSLPISFLDLCLFFLVSVQCGKTHLGHLEVSWHRNPVRQTDASKHCTESAGDLGCELLG